MVVVRFSGFGPYIICTDSRVEEDFGFSYSDSYDKNLATRLTDGCAVSLVNYFATKLNTTLEIEHV